MPISRREALRSSTRLALLAIGALLTVGGCADLATAPDEGVVFGWDGDVIGAGARVSVDDELSGDAMLAGGAVYFSGRTGGSLLTAAGTQEIAGSVGESLRTAGRNVQIRAIVDRNLTAAGASVVLANEGRVGGNAYVGAGAIELLGSIEGSARLAGGEVLLDGPIGGDVVVEAGELRVGPNARIEGDLEYRLGSGEASIDPSAEILGETRSFAPTLEEGGGGGRYVFYLARLLAFLLAGTAVVTVLPNAALAVSSAARDRTLASLGTGLVVLLAAPLLTAMIAFSLIGIPLALILALLFTIGLYLAPIPAALWLGRTVVPRLPEGVRTGPVAAFLAGGTLLSVASFIPLVGWVVRLVAVLLGLGASTIAIWMKASRGSQPSNG